ncbi:Uu.00g070800.m01.CDS01 [Anthostomella pinea]|uniref:Uu.00g070800.m01.CDS01 n=1 Tax=Anthostomella pinea TaxID=933095 RepID=A0AAI8VVE5_9PEZI|nr:Uu.00g070800.m01.CDS01 [Anthostomella pinea]
MDLPPELRLQIYHLAMSAEHGGGEPRNLHGLREPALSLVSRHARAEAVPVFFARCTFYCEARSNYTDIARIDALAAMGQLRPGRDNAAIERLSRLGRRALRCRPSIKVKLETNLWAAQHGQRVFGDVEIRIFNERIALIDMPHDTPDEVVRAMRRRSLVEESTLRVRMHRGSISFDCVDPVPQTIFHTELNRARDGVMNAARNTAEACADFQDNFLGLSRNDLVRISKPLFYWSESLDIHMGDIDSKDWEGWA